MIGSNQIDVDDEDIDINDTTDKMEDARVVVLDDDGDEHYSNFV